MTTADNALRGTRCLAPLNYFTPLNRLLADASDQLCRIALAHDLPADRLNAMATAYLAAEHLYGVAERIAHGEPSDPERCSTGMDLDCRLVIGKLAELRWRFGLPVVPDTADWQSRDWLADPFIVDDDEDRDEPDGAPSTACGRT